MTTAAGSITRDGNTWRLQGRDGAVYVWRGPKGLRCSCKHGRDGKRCRHMLLVLQHLTEALEEYAGER
jgi:hypothetical protein